MAAEGAGDEGVFIRAAARLREQMIETLVGELDRPHVVICRSRRSGNVTLWGPYDDALAAATAAEHERAAEAWAGEVEDLVFSVAPLHLPEAYE